MHCFSRGSAYGSVRPQLASARVVADTISDDQGKKIDWGVVESFDKWELLCGEICRHLNFLYTHTYKGG